VLEAPRRPDWYYKYRLRGVVVHTGSANGGHYYSFIKKSKEFHADGKWFLFDDANVTEWQKSDLGEQCFGGETTDQWGQGTLEKRRNAYLLFYERFPDPASETPPLEKAIIPKRIYDAIWEENTAYWMDQFTYDDDYFEFIKRILNKFRAEPSDVYASPPNPQADPKAEHTLLVTQLGVQFVFETICRSIHREQLQEITKYILEILDAHLPSCHWVMSQLVSPERRRWNTELLLHCENEDVRFAVGEIICRSLKRCMEYESKNEPKRELLLESSNVTEKKENSDFPLTTKYVDVLLEDLYLSNRFWKRFENYFRVLATYALHGKSQQIYLARSNLVPKLVDLYLGKNSPAEKGLLTWQTDAKGNRIRMGDSFDQPNWTHFWALLSSVVTRCDDPKAVKDAPREGHVLMHDMDKSFLLNRHFLAGMLAQAKTEFSALAIMKIVRHLAWNNKKFSDDILGMVMQGVEHSAHSDMLPYFWTMDALVSVEDDLTESRVQDILKSFLNVIGECRFYWKETLLCIEQLVCLADLSEACAAWLREHKTEKVDWIRQWFKKHLMKPPTGYTHEENNGMRLQRRRRDGEYGFSDTSATVPGKLATVDEKRDALEAILKGPLDKETSTLLDKRFRPQLREQIDARTLVGSWEEADVVNVSKTHVRVAFPDPHMPTRTAHEEVIALDSDRLAPHGQESHKARIRRRAQKGLTLALNQTHIV